MPWPAGADAVSGSRWLLQATPNPTDASYSRLIGVSCASPASCAAVGYYTSAAGVNTALAEEWNGISWTLQPPPEPTGATAGYLSAVSCAQPALCIAVGYFTDPAGVPTTLAERWDGAGWSIEPTPNPAGAPYSYLEGVSCPSATSCTAVGAFGNRRGHRVMLIERWTGTRWVIDRPPSPRGATASELGGVSCAPRGSCTAVGDFLRAGKYAPLALRWDGRGWSQQFVSIPGGASYTTLAAVSCPNSDSCTSVGYYSGGGGRNLSLAEQWNGESWSITPTGNPAAARGSELFAVSCPSTSSCTAAGNFASRARGFVTLAERFRRVRWRIQPTVGDPGATNSGFDGVSCPSSRSCIAVGYAIDRELTTLTLAEGFS